MGDSAGGWSKVTTRKIRTKGSRLYYCGGKRDASPRLSAILPFKFFRSVVRPPDHHTGAPPRLLDRSIFVSHVALMVRNYLGPRNTDGSRRMPVVRINYLVAAPR